MRMTMASISLSGIILVGLWSAISPGETRFFHSGFSEGSRTRVDRSSAEECSFRRDKAHDAELGRYTISQCLLPLKHRLLLLLPWRDVKIFFINVRYLHVTVNVRSCRPNSRQCLNNNGAWICLKWSSLDHRTHDSHLFLFAIFERQTWHTYATFNKSLTHTSDFHCTKFHQVFYTSPINRAWEIYQIIFHF